MLLPDQGQLAEQVYMCVGRHTDLYSFLYFHIQVSCKVHVGSQRLAYLLLEPYLASDFHRSR
jgi:hypothetical protein